MLNSIILIKLTDRKIVASSLAFLAFFTFTFTIISCANSQSPPAQGPLVKRSVDNGDLKVTYQRPRNSNLKRLYQIFQDTQEFDRLADDINARYSFPKDIQVYFAECGEANASYTSKNSTIELCYELIEEYVDIFGGDHQSKADYQDEVTYSTLFTFFHELGHAFIDIYKLPITGLEENVADEFAAMMLLALKDNDAVLAGLEQFDADSEEEDRLEELAFWDAHGLSAQRYFNVACIIYGSNPREFAELAGEDELPEERAQFCPNDYQRRLRSWNFLLSPYKKTTQTTGATLF